MPTSAPDRVADVDNAPARARNAESPLPVAPPDTQSPVGGGGAVLTGAASEPLPPPPHAASTETMPIRVADRVVFTSCLLLSSAQMESVWFPNAQTRQMVPPQQVSIVH